MGNSTPKFAMLLVFMGFALFMAFAMRPGAQKVIVEDRRASAAQDTLVAQSAKPKDAALMALIAHAKNQPVGSDCDREALLPLSELVVLKTINWKMLDAQIDGLDAEAKFAVAGATAASAAPENKIVYGAVMYVLLSAARDGNASAMNELGMAQLTCQYGVAQDLAEAKAWFENGVDAGDDYAMLNLGRMYLRGEAGRSGNMSDAKKGLRLLERCAEAGNASCQSMLEVYQNS